MENSAEVKTKLYGNEMKLNELSWHAVYGWASLNNVGQEKQDIKERRPCDPILYQVENRSIYRAWFRDADGGKVIKKSRAVITINAKETGGEEAALEGGGDTWLCLFTCSHTWCAFPYVYVTTC